MRKEDMLHKDGITLSELASIHNRFDKLENRHDDADKANVAIEEKVNGINKRLDVLNGSVAKHTVQIEEQRQEVRELPLLRRIVFGMVGLALVAMATALITQVFK